MKRALPVLDLNTQKWWQLEYWLNLENNEILEDGVTSVKNNFTVLTENKAAIKRNGGVKRG